MGPSSMPASGAGASRLLPTSSFSGLQLESPSSSRELIHEYKIVLLGDYKVGKTSLFGKITSKESRPTPSALPDGTQVAYRTVEVDGIYLRGHLWDQGCLRTTVDVKPAFFSDADAALLVYHTANRLSYDNLPAWVQHIRESTASPQLPIVIVGNGTGFTRWMQKKVTAEEASAFAAERGVTLFEYGSFTTDSDLAAMWATLLSQIHNRVATSREPSIYSYTTVNEVVSVKDAPYRLLGPLRRVTGDLSGGVIEDSD